MSYSKGIMWLDDCRIPFVDEGDKSSAKPQGKITSGTIENVRFNYTNDNTRIELPDKQSELGRFTPNLLVCDDMLNDGSISKSHQKEKNITKKHNYNINFGVGEKYSEINDKGTNSRYYDLDLWFNKMLDGL